VVLFANCLCVAYLKLWAAVGYLNDVIYYSRSRNFSFFETRDAKEIVPAQRSPTRRRPRVCEISVLAPEPSATSRVAVYFSQVVEIVLAKCAPVVNMSSKSPFIVQSQFFLINLKILPQSRLSIPFRLVKFLLRGQWR